MQRRRWRHDSPPERTTPRVRDVTTAPASEPRIRIYDVVAHGSTATGIEAAAGRQLDLPVAELARLLEVLGADGLRAFCLYLEHLEQVPGVDGELVLGVPHFSARWLLDASREAAEATGTAPMTKNAATRGHQAVERSGLLHSLANPPAVTGQGARGRTWRAVLNPRLVVIRGGRDDLDDLPRVRRGRPSKDTTVPLSPKLGKRDVGAGSPEAGKPGNGAAVPLPPDPGTRGPDSTASLSALVKAASPVSVMPDSTSAVGVVQELLTRQDRLGRLTTVMVPALHTDRPAVLHRLRLLFNDAPMGERSEVTVSLLALPMEETRRPDVLAELLAATLLGERDTLADLRLLGVSGSAMVSEHELRERMVVGLLIGWGLRRVESWGAWLYQATRPGWSPKPGPLLDRFTRLLESLAAAAAPPVRPPHEASLPAMAAPVHPRAVSQEMAPAPAGIPSDGPVLPEETVTRYFAAARRKWPMFCRDGSVQASDPVWRSRLVRMYLAEEERHAELDTTEQVASR